MKYSGMTARRFFSTCGLGLELRKIGKPVERRPGRRKRRIELERRNENLRPVRQPLL